jgi:hypothetical protein
VKKIREYRIKKDIVGDQTCYITKGAEIVSVVDLGYDEVALFALCDAIEISTDLRTFRICNTYDNIYDNSIKYVGHICTQHIIEIL